MSVIMIAAHLRANGRKVTSQESPAAHPPADRPKPNILRPDLSVIGVAICRQSSKRLFCYERNSYFTSLNSPNP